MDLAKLVFDRIQFAINPALYSSIESEDKEDFNRQNIAFSAQSEFGRATGQMKSPKPVAKAIQKFYEDRKSGKQKVIYANINGLRGAPKEDDGTLG